MSSISLEEKVESFFFKTYGQSPEVLIKSPGRINLIGEHTDYNEGYVLPAAVDKCFIYGASLLEEKKVKAYAIDLDEYVEFSLDDTSKTNRVWVNFLKGLLIELQEYNNIGGLQLVFSSDIPIGGGMSSSSALECGFLACINELYKLGLDKWQMINMSHRSNHNYMGVKGGILDQFSSFFGKSNHCMLLDCRNRNFKYIPLDLKGHTFVLIDSKVSHNHVDGNYNTGPKKCAEAVSKIGEVFADVQSLRDVDIKMLDEVSLSPHLINRVTFIIEENQRVLDFVENLEKQDIESLGSLLYGSHEGLRGQYKVSCKELDLLVELAQDHHAVKGARMMGGGFGGCTINLIENGSEKAVVNSILQAYKLKTGIEGEAYYVQASQGVHRIR